MKSLIKNFIQKSPYIIEKKRLPESHLDTVRIALALHMHQRQNDRLIVQIGANDGVTSDPIHDLIQCFNATAFLVEPLPSNFKKLQERYESHDNIHTINAAIGKTNGTQSIWKLKDDGKWKSHNWTGLIASFDKEHLIRHGASPSEIEEIQVETITLSTLLERYSLKSLPFLQTDTEGFDDEIVKMAIDLPSPPKFINFEHTGLSIPKTRSLFDALALKRYRWVHSRWDSLAVHESAIEIPTSLSEWHRSGQRHQKL